MGGIFFGIAVAVLLAGLWEYKGTVIIIALVAVGIYSVVNERHYHLISEKEIKMDNSHVYCRIDKFDEHEVYCYIDAGRVINESKYYTLTSINFQGKIYDCSILSYLPPQITLAKDCTSIGEYMLTINTDIPPQQARQTNEASYTIKSVPKISGKLEHENISQIGAWWW